MTKFFSYVFEVAQFQEIYFLVKGLIKNEMRVLLVRFRFFISSGAALA
jgi:hypothetical protein